MDVDTRRKLIIGALDPRHDDDDQAACPGVGTRSAAKNRDPDCRSGFFVISYGNPGDLRQVGDFVDLPAGHTASCINDCDYVWTGGPARRDDLDFLGPFTAGGRGDGRPIWVTDLRNARKPKVFGNPIDLWRNDQAHRLLARRPGRRARHRLGERPRRDPRLRHEGHATATRTPTSSARRRRGTRSSWRAAGSLGSTSPRRCSCTTRGARPTAP